MQLRTTELPGAAAAQRAGKQLGTGGHASCRTFCNHGAFAHRRWAATRAKWQQACFAQPRLTSPTTAGTSPGWRPPQTGWGLGEHASGRAVVVHASTHGLCGPRRRSSGWAAPGSALAAFCDGQGSAVPSVAKGCGRPSPVNANADTTVTSQHI